MDQPLTPAGTSRTEGFGGTELVRTGQTLSTALAEQAKAAVQARYIMAMQRPRSLIQARTELLADCARPAFADAAIFKIPRGGKTIEGASIRFAEAAARALRNIFCETVMVYDDSEKRLLRVSATDLETNLSFDKMVTVAKTIERKKPMPGRRIVMERQNSYGEPVYVIEAIDDEILDKEGSLVSKALRDCIIRLVPGDLKEEAIEKCYATGRGEISKDPAVARKKMVDAFATQGVSLQHLTEYLGHSVDSTTVDELEELRGLYTSLKDKETTWKEVMSERGGTQSAQQQPSGADGKKPETAAERAAAKAKDVAKPTASVVDPATGEKVAAEAMFDAPKQAPKGGA